MFGLKECPFNEIVTHVQISCQHPIKKEFSLDSEDKASASDIEEVQGEDLEAEKKSFIQYNV